VIENDGRLEWIRAIDLFRVKNEVNHLKPSSSLAFRIVTTRKNPEKSLSFGDELVTSLFLG
jgi:hypothetical protein